MKKRVFILLAFAVVASPVYAADNCSGEFTFQPTGNSPGDVSIGKITTWTKGGKAYGVVTVRDPYAR